jgi:hypothetical protein
MEINTHISARILKNIASAFDNFSKDNFITFDSLLYNCYLTYTTQIAGYIQIYTILLLEISFLTIIIW